MRNRAAKKLQTDRRTDRPTDRQADSYIPPPNRVFGGIKIASIQKWEKAVTFLTICLDNPAQKILRYTELMKTVLRTNDNLVEIYVFIGYIKVAVITCVIFMKHRCEVQRQR